MKRESAELIHRRKQANVDHWNGLYPIAIFSSDGTAEHVNEYFLWKFGIEEASLFIGKYNLLNDQVFRRKKSVYEKIEKAFNGEKVTLCNFKAPFKTFMDMGIIKGIPPEMPHMDANLLPTYENGKFDSVYLIFHVLNGSSHKDTKAQREERKAR